MVGNDTRYILSAPCTPPQLAAARDAAEEAAGKLRGALAEARKERDFALAAKQAAADAAAALERDAAGRAEGKRQAVTTLQSAISQLQVCLSQSHWVCDAGFAACQTPCRMPCPSCGWLCPKHSAPTALLPVSQHTIE